MHRKIALARSTAALVFVLAAPASAQILEARLGAAYRQVEILGPTPHAGSPGDILERGQRVRTGSRASARVDLAGATLTLGENTTLVMFAPATAPRPNLPPSDDISLSRGAVLVRVPDVLTHGLALATPGGMVVSHGEVLLQVDARRVTRVQVYRGRAVVRAAGRAVVLRAGQGVRVDAGRPASLPRALPQAPVWSPPPPVRVLAGASGGEVSAGFATATGQQAPARWHVQIAHDERFENLVLDVTQPAVQARLEARGLEGGTYYARVSAIDADQFEGPFSIPASFVVGAPRVVPGGGGRRASVQMPAGFYCGLDGAPLVATGGPLWLAAGRAHRLRCAANADGAGATEIPISAAEAGPLVRRIRVEPTGFSREGGMRTLLIELSDGAGAPVPYATIEARANAGVSVAPPREGDVRGTYTTTVAWPPGIPEVRIQFVINGSEQFEYVMGP